MKLKTALVETRTLRSLLVDEEILPTSALVVDSWRQEIESTGQCPPLIVCFDGADYWLFDGYHRLEAIRSLGFNACQVTVFHGSRRDALRRYIKDKLRSKGRDGGPTFSHCLRLLCEDPEWRQSSVSDLSRQFARKPAFFAALSLYRIQDRPDQFVNISISKHGSLRLLKC